ncbi:type II toxin-antitoxin system PemK/MazF family toxin [Arthrobacter sp. ZGTC212]|uniref:type II toxin-antitoxin system PemK/MazF family toxin n=1 Tax=Arthrobacter sp. ZGTC212 TaxID=2058899 RepID=UPI000CE3EBAC|nr:type II toxin-antitoxin system PemK/MazF family toxin [Arthrobacter sp. ZGTC212]
MSFSNRSLLSLARSAIRLLTRPSAGTGTSTKPGRSNPGSSNTRNKTAAPKPAAKKSPARKPPVQKSPAPKPASNSSAYPGDYRGKVTPVYAPSPDGSPDPGEVVWAWVPYEDDYSQGKDRPVLLIGRTGSRLLALMMTTRDRNNGRESDPDYVDVGTGPWDSQGRPSEVKLDRVLQLDPAAVRRQGSIMSAAAFQRVSSRFTARN